MAAWSQEAVVDRSEIVSWREEQLLRVGYGPAEATRLAEHGEVDLHLAVELVERGCAPKLALRILL